MDISGNKLPHVSRRRMLQTAGSLTALGVLGNSATMPVAAEPGGEKWTVQTGAPVFSSPTVVDGTAFVGSD